MGHTVLLVDDDENILHGLARALRRQPYQLYTAALAEEAVWILKTHRVDVIVADEKMPGMGGGDLLAWTAEHFPDVMRIMLTGHATVDSAIRAINKGSVFHYFIKPCRDADLAVAIRKALERRDLARENHRLLALSEHQLGELRQFRHDLETLDRLVSQDLHGHLTRLVRACQPTDGQTAIIDPDAIVLVDNVLDVAAEVRRLVSKLVEQSRAEQATSHSSMTSPDEQPTEPTEPTEPATEGPDTDPPLAAETADSASADGPVGSASSDGMTYT
ncbi:MAG: hypothetical protein A2V70_20135 [Planctomycetes bacterium RBG_13_63_9]|nr:MAG: hypothetical protein A2V70_20135 [Planctomycetes bacterium RBG_13_63_9]